MYKRFTSPEGYFKSEDTPYIQAYKFSSNSCMHYKFPSIYARILSSMQVKLPISLEIWRYASFLSMHVSICKFLSFPSRGIMYA